MDAALCAIEDADRQLTARVEQIKLQAELCLKAVSESQKLCEVMSTLGQNMDLPFPVKFYCQIWVSRTTIARYVKDGMNHAYHEGQMTVTPREFFKYYTGSRTEKPTRGKGLASKRNSAKNVADE